MKNTNKNKVINLSNHFSDLKHTFKRLFFVFLFFRVCVVSYGAGIRGENELISQYLEAIELSLKFDKAKQVYYIDFLNKNNQPVLIDLSRLDENVTLDITFHCKSQSGEDIMIYVGGSYPFSTGGQKTEEESYQVVISNGRTTLHYDWRSHLTRSVKAVLKRSDVAEVDSCEIIAILRNPFNFDFLGEQKLNYEFYAEKCFVDFEGLTEGFELNNQSVTERIMSVENYIDSK